MVRINGDGDDDKKRCEKNATWELKEI
jgi:hypothetical protein